MPITDDLLASLQSLAKCQNHPAICRSSSPAHAALWWETIQGCDPKARKEHLAWLGRNDLFFLLVYILKRAHFVRNERTARWTFARCTEVQEEPDGYVDLWPRESFKSEIITFGKTIQDLINNPELTFAFFSHTRPMAAKLMYPIRQELEANELLKSIYPDVLWADPKHSCREHSLRWTDHALTLKRKGNPKEATIEAWGLTDGQPIGSRFTDIVYDDVVSRDKISDLMIQTTTDALRNSFLLTASDPARYRYIATYQEIGDTTQQIIDQGVFKLRRHGPLDENGEVAFCSDEKFTDLRSKLGAKVFALQILLDPSKSKDEHDLGFRDEWLEYYDEQPPRRMMNVYGLVDPAGDSPDSNSQFALWIVGLGADKRARILDIVLDKFDLEDCWQTIFGLQQKWECLKWGYEKFGMQRDIDHYHYRMREVHYNFTIIALGGVRRSKDQRISELIPWFRERRIILPRRCVKQLKDGRDVDLVKYFREREYSLWPYNARQRDMLDALARITDSALGVVYPRGYSRSWRDDEGGYAAAGQVDGGGGGWMSQ